MKTAFTILCILTSLPLIAAESKCPNIAWKDSWGLNPTMYAIPQLHCSVVKDGNIRNGIEQAKPFQEVKSADLCIYRAQVDGFSTGRETYWLLNGTVNGQPYFETLGEVSYESIPSLTTFVAGRAHLKDPYKMSATTSPYVRATYSGDTSFNDRVLVESFHGFLSFKKAFYRFELACSRVPYLTESITVGGKSPNWFKDSDYYTFSVLQKDEPRGSFADDLMGAADRARVFSSFLAK